MVIGIIAGILSGVAIVLARTVNARLAEGSSSRFSTLMNYVTGIIGAIIIALIANESLPENNLSFNIGMLPMFLGGAIGAMLVYISNRITSKLPTYTMTLLLFCGQIASGIIIDLLAGDALHMGKIIGAVLITIGLLINRPRKNESESDDG